IRRVGAYRCGPFQVRARWRSAMRVGAVEVCLVRRQRGPKGEGLASHRAAAAGVFPFGLRRQAVDAAAAALLRQVGQHAAEGDGVLPRYLLDGEAARIKVAHLVLPVAMMGEMARQLTRDLLVLVLRHLEDAEVEGAREDHFLLRALVGGTIR